MSIIGKALFIATVMNPAGNATTSTEVALIVPLDECPAIMQTYTEKYQSRVTNMRTYSDRWEFEEEIVGINNSITLVCKEIKER